ncbi:hypothetical protein ACOSP7_024022 [Xanthoceras sorbifolium]
MAYSLLKQSSMQPHRGSEANPSIFILKDRKIEHVLPVPSIAFIFGLEPSLLMPRRLYNKKKKNVNQAMAMLPIGHFSFFHSKQEKQSNEIHFDPADLLFFLWTVR